MNDQLPLLRVYEDFLTGEELSYWQSLVRREEFWEQTDPFRHSEDSKVGYQLPHYVMDGQYLNDSVPEFFEKEEELVKKICGQVEGFFGEDFVVGSQIYFRKWVQGHIQHMHLDHAFSEGKLDFRLHGDEPESAMPIAFHDVATVLYYNDDFEGGELTFPNCDVSIKPKPGMLVMFPCTELYGHGVKEILSGERYISAHFWTRAKTIAMDASSPILGDAWSKKIRWREKVDRHLTNDA